MNSLWAKNLDGLERDLPCAFFGQCGKNVIGGHFIIRSNEIMLCEVSLSNLLSVAEALYGCKLYAFNQFCLSAMLLLSVGS